MYSLHILQAVLKTSNQSIYKKIILNIYQKSNTKMNNRSSQNLIVSMKKSPTYADIEQIQFQRKEMKKAKTEQLDHLYNENYQPAKYSKALNYKNMRSYKMKQSNGLYKQLDAFEDTEGLKHFGLGPYFFIEYMRRLSWLFFVFTIISAFMIYINFSSDRLGDYTPTFSTYLIETTLGNYNGKHITDFDNEILAIGPGVIFVFYMIFHFFWKAHYFSEIETEEENHSIVKPEKFCIEIQGIDEEHVDERELERFFSSFGPIYEVSLVRRFKNKLSFFEELDCIEEKIKEEELQIILGSGDPQNLAVLKQQKEKLNKYINTLRINPKIISAFIHFQYEKSKVDCLAYYNDHYLFDTNLHDCMNSICCCCVDTVEQKYLFKGRPLKIKNSKVQKPEDVNWESYDIDDISKVFRVFFAILIIVLFIAMSCTIIGLCSIYINTHATDCQEVDVTKDCLTVQCSAQEKTCYCNKNIIISFSNDAIKNSCGSQLDQIYVAQGIQYVVVGISALTNFIFGFVVGKIVDFTRPTTYSSGLMAKTVIYTLFLIFNTVFIPILIFSDIYGFKTTDYVSLLTIVSSDLKETLKVDELSFYLDFERIWYSNVSPIFTNYIVFDIAFTIFFFFYYKCISDKQGLKDDEGTILQKSMNEKITSFQLNIYVEYAYFNLITFMGLFLCAGIPAVIPLVWVSLLLKYMSFRSIILKDSTRIEGLGEGFMAYPLTFTPILIIVSCMFGCWMLTANENLIPPNLQMGIEADLPESINFHQLTRILYLPWYIIIALLMFVWFFFENTIIRFCVWVSSLCFEKKQVVHPYHTRPFSDYAKTMNVLKSYNIRNNDKLRNAILNLEKYLVMNEDKF